jgi:hypothetical protein
MLVETFQWNVFIIDIYFYEANAPQQKGGIQLLRMVGLTPHFIKKPRRDVPPERLYNCVECRKIVR